MEKKKSKYTTRRINDRFSIMRQVKEMLNNMINIVKTMQPRKMLTLRMKLGENFINTD